jgi:hypothetical protein
VAESNDPFGMAIEGAQAGQQMVKRAVDIERQQFQLEQQKVQAKAGKLDLIFSEMNKVLVQPKGKLRELTKERAKMKIQSLGMPIDPLVWDTLDNDDLQVHYTKVIADVMGIPDAKTKAQHLDQILPFLDDYQKTVPALLKQSQDISQAKMKLAMEQKDKSNKTLQDLLRDRTKNDITKRTSILRESINKIRVSAGEMKANPVLAAELAKAGISVHPDAAGDLALIFNFMRMQDPGSVVREGEFAIAAASRSLPGDIQALFQSVSNGTRLTPAQRKQFVNRAEGIWKSQQFSQANFDKDIIQQGRALGVNEDDLRKGLGGKTSKQLKARQVLKQETGLNDEQLDELASKPKDVRDRFLKTARMRMEGKGK